MAIGQENIRNRWGYHPGTDVTIPRHELIREAYISFAEFLDKYVPDGRPKSTAFTKLQESSMWANFGIAQLSPVVLPNGSTRDVDPSRQQPAEATSSTDETPTP